MDLGTSADAVRPSSSPDSAGSGRQCPVVSLARHSEPWHAHPSEIRRRERVRDEARRVGDNRARRAADLPATRAGGLKVVRKKIQAINSAPERVGGCGRGQPQAGVAALGGLSSSTASACSRASSCLPRCSGRLSQRPSAPPARCAPVSRDVARLGGALSSLTASSLSRTMTGSHAGVCALRADDGRLGARDRHLGRQS